MEINLGKERRRWSEEAKRALLAEAEQPGETVTSVARRHGINASMLFAWRKQMDGGPGNAAAQSAQPRFVPLAIASAAPAAPSNAGSAPSIELEFGSARVRIVGAVDVDLVATVLKALPLR
jgi:transposase